MGVSVVKQSEARAGLRGENGAAAARLHGEAVAYLDAAAAVQCLPCGRTEVKLRWGRGRAGAGLHPEGLGVRLYRPGRRCTVDEVHGRGHVAAEKIGLEADEARRAEG